MGIETSFKCDGSKYCSSAFVELDEDKEWELLPHGDSYSKSIPKGWVFELVNEYDDYGKLKKNPTLVLLCDKCRDSEGDQFDIHSKDNYYE